MGLPLTLSGLLEARKREFPITAERPYFAHAAVSPLPRRVVDAMSAYLSAASERGQFAYLHGEQEQRCRELGAALIGAKSSEIALVPSTSAGLNLVAAGLSWRRDDELIYVEDDFLSNVLPWAALREERGVVPVAVPRDELGVVTNEALLERVSERTRLVAISSVDFVTGVARDLQALGDELHARGIWLCVDAIQGLGAVPTSARSVDFLVADGHKWLLGPQGMGLLYVSSDRLSDLRPPQLGWKSVQGSYREARAPLWNDARRYEPGSLNAVGIVGLASALELLLEVEIPAIAARLGLLREQIIELCRPRGLEPIGGNTAPGTSPFVSVKHASVPSERIYHSLDEHQVVVSLRHDHDGNSVLRIAPHFYTAEEDLARLAEGLDRALG